ncbi:hypothetical protein LSH36_102g00040 [Paralvinella palmiformis]|uniref:Anaphase-promoting complex subunit 2 TPR repeats domain-containing protein n=1 Tax=Paralvinella palmiformis TaxID=53620 RepID=A0AAD9JZK4_9ANNE|nr:hypothetical protein LSH36_102g00040 [Paralvinella palmiformis]
MISVFSCFQNQFYVIVVQRPLRADMASELDQAWNFITNFLFSDQSHPQEEHVIHALEILCANEMHQIIEPWFFEIVQQQLCSQVAPQFWSKFETPIPISDVVDHIQSVFDDMYLKLSTYWTSVKQLESIQNYLSAVSNRNRHMQDTKDLHVKLILLFKAILFPVFPKNTRNFQNALQHFFSKAFKAFDVLSRKSAELDSSNETDGDSFNMTDSLTCVGCEEEIENCHCKHIMATFHQLNHQLRDLGLLERLGGEVVSTLIHDRIRQHVELTCKGNFETEYLSTLENWLATKVVGWLELMYGEVQENKSEVKSPIHSHKERLLNLMYETYARIHIDQMFTIIIEYPESLPGLQDLKVCLEKVNLRGVLVQSLRQALETRLLHPGVNTTDILTAYINAIRALRVLDPSGVLLDLV